MPISTLRALIALLFIFFYSTINAQISNSIDTFPYIKGAVNSIDIDGKYRVYGGKFSRAGRQVNGFAVYNKNSVEHLNPFSSFYGNLYDVSKFGKGWLVSGDIKHAYDTTKINNLAYFDADFKFDYKTTKAIENMKKGSPYSTFFKGDTLITHYSIKDQSSSTYINYLIAYDTLADTIIWKLRTTGVNFKNVKVKDSLLMFASSTPSTIYDYNNQKVQSCFISINVNKGRLAKTSPVINNGGVTDMLVIKNQLFLTGSFTKSDQYSRKYFVQYNISNGLVSSWTPTLAKNGKLSYYKDDIFWTDNNYTDSILTLKYKDEKTEYLNLDFKNYGYKIKIHSSHVVQDTMYLFLETLHENLWKIDLSKNEIISKHQLGIYPNSKGRFKLYENDFVYVEDSLSGVIAHTDGTILSGGAILLWDKEEKTFTSFPNSLTSVSLLTADNDFYALSNNAFYKISKIYGSKIISDGGIANNSNNKINKLQLYKNELLVIGKIYDGSDAYPLAGIDLTTNNIKYYGGKGFTGEVLTSALEADTLYIGGDFKTIGNKTRDYIAALDLNKNNIMSWAPAANDVVQDIKIIDSSLVFVSGNFTFIGGASKEVGAYLSRLTGATNSFSLNNKFYNYPSASYKIAIIDTLLLITQNSYSSIYKDFCPSRTHLFSTKSGDVIANIFGCSFEKNTTTNIIADGQYAINYGASTKFYKQEGNLMYKSPYKKEQKQQKINLRKPQLISQTQDCRNFQLLFEKNNPALLHILSKDSNKTFNLDNKWYSQQIGFSPAYYFDSTSYVVGHGFNLNIDNLKDNGTWYLYTYSSNGYNDSIAYNKSPIITKLEPIQQSNGINFLSDTIQCFTSNVFTFKSNVADSSIWSFSDATKYQDVDSISHSFKKPGTYQLNYSYKNGACQITDSIKVNVIEVIKPKIELLSDSLICRGRNAKFNFEMKDTIQPSISWKINNVLMNTAFTESIFIPKIIKPFDISITIKNNSMCSNDSIVKKIKIEVDSFDVSSITSSTVCFPQSVFNYKAKTSDTTIWNMGDGKTITTTNSMAYQYKEPGYYNITVTKVKRSCLWKHSIYWNVKDVVTPEFYLNGDSLYCKDDKTNLFISDSSANESGKRYKGKWYVDDVYLSNSYGNKSYTEKATKSSTIKVVLTTNDICAVEDTIIKSMNLDVDVKLEKPRIFVKNGKLMTISNSDKYVWYKNYNSLQSDSQYITLRGPGRYHLKIMNNCGYVESDILVIEEKEVGLDELSDLEFNVFPNPASTTLKISVDDKKKHSYQMFNAYGKLVLNGSFTNEALLDISYLSDGIYFILLDKHHRKKVILSK